MITEDYVSFEIAKLMKEKKFPQVLGESGCVNIIPYYTQNGQLCTCDLNFIRQRYYPEAVAPTLQMAMKWLREKHNLCIEPYRTACGYLCTISAIPSGSGMYSQEYEGDDESSGQFTTFEKACEAAIKYSLENLI